MGIRVRAGRFIACNVLRFRRRGNGEEFIVDRWQGSRLKA